MIASAVFPAAAYSSPLFAYFSIAACGSRKHPLEQSVMRRTAECLTRFTRGLDERFGIEFRSPCLQPGRDSGPLQRPLTETARTSPPEPPEARGVKSLCFKALE